MNKLNDFQKDIKDKINESWSLDEIIRFVYIESGKLLSKNVKFFYSLGKKMEDENYEYHELKNVYEMEESNNLSLICKSTAVFLKGIFDELNIETKLMQTTSAFNVKNENNSNEEFDIYHWFLCVKGSNNKQYFLTLVPDLYNIQFNLKTKHFANHIPYYKSINEENVKMYVGDEIDNYIMSEEEIEQLDLKIGYATGLIQKGKDGKTILKAQYNDNFFEYLKDFSRKDKYYSELGFDSDFYKEITNYKVDNINIIDYINLENFSFEQIDKWTDFIRDRAYYYIKDKQNIKSVNGQINGLNKIIKEKNYGKYRLIMGQLVRAFVDNECKKDKDGFCSSIYIKNKFEYLFPILLSLNSNEKPLTFRFSGIAEQLDFIDLFLENLFIELTEKNANKGIDLNSKYSIVRNRIQRYVLYKKDTAEYEIVFKIDNLDLFYLFDPYRGTLKKINNFLELISDNKIIISDELKNSTYNIEDIEAKGTTSLKK